MAIGSFCYKKHNDHLMILQPKSLEIKGVQKGFVQYLQITQSIRSDQNLDEVSYIFPTDNNLCVYNMKFKIGDEIITANIKDKSESQKIFDESKKIGLTAAVTEEIAPGLTSIKIGNVPKNQTVSIIFDCAMMCSLQNRTTILCKIPLQAAEPDGSIIDLYDLPSLKISVDIDIFQMQEISDVYANCESNYNKIDNFKGNLKINSGIFTDENILIMTNFTNPVKSQMVQAFNSTAISFIPEFEPEKNDMKEYVFLIDCSTSMVGESIRNAKKSIHSFYSKIPNGSYFNIICFGSTYKKLFPHSTKKEESQNELTMNFISNIKANLGGTEMLLMLDDLFQDEIKIGSQRQIFVITDGEVYERSKVIQKVGDNCSMNRIFAIGLGHGADAGFLDEIAEMTNGKSDFVFNCEELPSKIEEQLELSLSNAATDVEINIEGNDSFQVAPYPLPPLLPHVVTHIFISSSLPIGDAMLSFKPYETEVDNVISMKCEWSDKKEQKSPIFALFAQKQLKKISQDQQKSIELSLSSGVLCKYTSYIAVSENCYISRKDTARFYDSPCDLMDDGFSSGPHDELSDPIDPFAWQYWKDCHPPFSCSDCDSFSSAAPPAPSFNSFGSPSETAIPEPLIENKLYYENKSQPGDDLFALSPDSKESTSHASFDPFSSAAPPAPSFNPFSSPSATAIPEPPIENKLYYENKSQPGDDLFALSPDSKESTSHASFDPFSSAAPPAPSFNPFSSSSSSMLNTMSQCQSSCSFSSGFTNTTTLKTSPPSYSHADHSDLCGLPSSHEDPFSAKDHLESSPKEKGDAMMNDFGSSQTQDFNDDIDDHSNVWDKNASINDVIRLQSRDGFWDLPTSFVSKSFGGSLPNIDVDLSHSPIIKKRVMSSIFALGFLEKFQKTNLNKWKHAKEKCFKWLKRINSSVDWDKIIQSCLTKIF